MPTNNSLPAQGSTASSIDIIRGRHLKILIVDDEDRFREALSFNLGEKYDAVVTDVGSGSDAIELLEAGQAFDIVFLDLMMPVMNGIETYQRLKNIDSHCAIIMMSSHSDSAECLQAEKLAGELLSKPDLAQMLSKILFSAARR